MKCLCHECFKKPLFLSNTQKKKKLKMAKELSDMVIYCKSVHFNGFDDARENLSFYEMSSFKEGKAMKLAEESGEEETHFDFVKNPLRVFLKKGILTFQLPFLHRHILFPIISH